MQRDLTQNLTADLIISEDYYVYFMLPIESVYFNHNGDVLTVVDAFLSIRNSNYNYFYNQTHASVIHSKGTKSPKLHPLKSGLNSPAVEN